MIINTQNLINHNVKLFSRGKLTPLTPLLHVSCHFNMTEHACSSENKKHFSIQIWEWIFFFIQISEKAMWRMNDVLSGFRCFIENLWIFQEKKILFTVIRKVDRNNTQIWTNWVPIYLNWFLKNNFRPRMAFLFYISD